MPNLISNWLMEARNGRGPENLLLVLVLAVSGLDLSKTGTIGERMGDFHTRLTVVEYRVTELEGK